MTLRIATYNIHKGVSTLRGLPCVHALKQAIHTLDVDLIFLQEVQGRHDFNATQYGDPQRGHAHWPEQAQHDFLAGDTHRAAYGMNAAYLHGHHGNALLSRLPIISSGNHDVSTHAFEQRGILHCMIDYQGQRLHCYVVHFGLFAKGRARQAQALIDVVRNSAAADEPVIIAGDFNDWRNHLSPLLRSELALIEVFDERRSGPRAGIEQRGRKTLPKQARTFPAFMPWLRLDRIYVRGFHVETAQVLSGSQWGKLSDHAPILATLQAPL
jgi:endonuclease/exonuclease/phosphatase family metal-dependent hydrolase